MFFRGFRGLGSCFGFGNGFYGGWFMPLMMAVFIAVTIVAVILIMKKSKHSSMKNSYNASLEELKIEFAKGKLTEEEYLRKKKVLND
jgi:putative membrane protein